MPSISTGTGTLPESRSRLTRRGLAACGLAIALAGCGSSRFGSGPRGPEISPVPPTYQRSGVVYNTPGSDGGPFGSGPGVIEAPGPAPSLGGVAAAPLPPPAGAAQQGAGGFQGGGLPSGGFQGGGLEGNAGGFSGSADGSAPAATIREPQTLARANPGAEQTLTPNVSPPASRSSLVGGWNARDEAGGSCRVQLSSAPALDLYRASAPGCSNKELARVNAWDFRDGEIYLYQPGGAVVARLRQGGGGFDGVISRSGASLSLRR